MCGISGILNFNGSIVTQQELKQMTDSLIHRGPDGEGHWISKNHSIGLGHRRLSIIDLSEMGKQPMHYLNRYTITFNGEIYNYIELKSYLENKGYKFQSKTDTEVLLALYDFKKENCLNDLDGMFAFAIWDEQEQTLFCARDRFGEKPFYFHNSKTRFVFASEMKALFAMGISKNINNGIFFNYIADGSVADPHNKFQTFYEEIQKLEAAHFIIIKNGKAVHKRYWSIDLENKSDISFDEAIIQFKELLLQSIQNRMRSDVPVGSSLSGGLDSSTIVSIVDSFHTGSQQTFSASFPGYEKDETRFMNMVIKNTKTNPHFTTPTADTLVNELDKLFYHQEEPFASASVLAQWEVMKLAKQQSTIVLLDGQGADELLGGYSYYYRSFFQELYSSEKTIFKKEYDAYKNWGGNHFKFDWKFKLQANFPSSYNVYLNLRAGPVAHPDIHPDFYNQHKLSTYKPISFKPTLNNHLNNTISVNGMLEALLRYSDRNSMAFSREVRLPFLSPQLVKFVFSLPSTYKIHNGWSKYLLRKSYEGIIPKEITWRKEKIGYAPPENQWMQTPRISEMLQESISELEKRKILNRSKLDPRKIWIYLMAANLIKNG